MKRYEISVVFTLMVLASGGLPARAQQETPLARANRVYYAQRAGLPEPPPPPPARPAAESLREGIARDAAPVSPVRQVTPVARVQEGEPSPAPAPEPEPEAGPEPQEPTPDEVRRRVGEASTRYEALQAACAAAYQRLAETLQQAQGTTSFEENLRRASQLSAFYHFLTELERLGLKVLADEQAFRAAFRQFQGVSEEAADEFGNAADYFDELARGAEFEQTREMLNAASRWYAARAHQARAAAAVRVPTEYETERRRFREFLWSVQRLKEMVRDDPFMFRDTEGVKLLAAFSGYYSKLTSALNAWTDQILDETTREVDSARATGPQP